MKLTPGIHVPRNTKRHARPNQGHRNNHRLSRLSFAALKHREVPILRIDNKHFLPKHVPTFAGVSHIGEHASQFETAMSSLS